MSTVNAVNPIKVAKFVMNEDPHHHTEVLKNVY